MACKGVCGSPSRETISIIKQEYELIFSAVVCQKHKHVRIKITDFEHQ